MKSSLESTSSQSEQGGNHHYMTLQYCWTFHPQAVPPPCADNDEGAHELKCKLDMHRYRKSARCTPALQKSIQRTPAIVQVEGVRCPALILASLQASAPSLPFHTHIETATCRRVSATESSLQTQVGSRRETVHTPRCNTPYCLLWTR